MPIANGYVPCQMNVSNQMVCLEWHHWQFITYMFAENGPCLEQCAACCQMAVFENLFEQNILINSSSEEPIVVVVHPCVAVMLG